MKDFNDILNTDFLNSAISDELLAAYIDGNTTESENALIESTLNGDSMLSEACEIASDSVSFGSSFDWELHKGDFGFWELGLPPVVTEGDIDNCMDNNKEIIDYSMTDMFNSPMQVIGEAGENISDPIFIQQPDDHSCALRSQQIVLRDFGIDIPFDKLEQIALDNGVYTHEGTYTYDIGKVLELAGVGMHQVTGSTMYDLMYELAQGHRVIVSVDANELWYDSILKNWFDDVFGTQGGNHALIVAGVEINPYDTSDIKVVLTDPGSGDLRIEYPADQFMDAWKDSNSFMAATDAPAPYQYDASTGMEIPSNFSVQQHFNQFITDNSFQLSPDLINVPTDYQPAFTGHLDMVGNMNYESFKTDYDLQKQSESESINVDTVKDDDLFARKDISKTDFASTDDNDDEEDGDGFDGEDAIGESDGDDDSSDGSEEDWGEDSL